MFSLRKPLKWLFEALDSPLDRIFGQELNPSRNLGPLGFYFLWVAFISGIYVYIFFDTSVVGAYQSLEQINREQWWLGGVMRSLHRYGSDGLVLFMVLHLLREIAYDRYRGPRWFSWVTGTPVLWLVIIAGITGYWLVWDERAQYVAVVTAQWLDQTALFGGLISRNFLTEGSLGDRFFTLLMFIHIAVPLFLLFASWIHLQRISRARIHAPTKLIVVFTLAQVVLSLWKPAMSQAPANLGKVPGNIEIDWFYLAFYPMFDGDWAPAIWSVGAIITLLLILLPWLPPGKHSAPAVVDLERCNGCRRCVDDCPYNAVSMQARTDGRPFEEEAIVRSDLCVSCGICVGSCPSSTPFRRTSGLVTGIDTPDFNLARLYSDTIGAAGIEPGRKQILVFACQQAHGLDSIPDDGTGVVRMPCIGMLPPSFIDFAIRRGYADGVYLEGCSGGDCRNRFGAEWTAARVAGTRDPYLRRRVPRNRLRLGWVADSSRTLAKRLEDFTAEIAELENGEEEQS